MQALEIIMCITLLERSTHVQLQDGLVEPLDEKPKKAIFGKSP
jgi:hypothetical protein